MFHELLLVKYSPKVCKNVVLSLLLKMRFYLSQMIGRHLDKHGDGHTYSILSAFGVHASPLILLLLLSLDSWLWFVADDAV